MKSIMKKIEMAVIELKSTSPMHLIIIETIIALLKIMSWIHCSMNGIKIRKILR